MEVTRWSKKTRDKTDKTDAVDGGGDPGRYYEMHQPVELQCARAR